MSKETVLVTQGGNDAFNAVAINTGLTVDGKAGWQVNGIEAFWTDGSAVVPGDWSIFAIVSTINTLSVFGSDDEFGRVGWGLQNTAGVAVAVQYEPIRSLAFQEPRVTVQPQIYCQVSSTSTGQANDIIFAVYYEIVKLTDIEVLRLLAGGA